MKKLTQVFLVWMLLCLALSAQAESNSDQFQTYNKINHNWSELSEAQYVDNLVACELKLQEYKWSKNIWPEANQKPKPAFNEVADVDATYRQVLNTLKKQAVLADKFNIAITDTMLQRDLHRMARTSRDGKGLKTLFAVMDNNPETIARCLSQPYLVAKIFDKSFYWNQELHQNTKTKAENELALYRHAKSINLNDAQVNTVIYQVDTLVHQKKPNEQDANDQDTNDRYDNPAQRSAVELDEDEYQQKLLTLGNTQLQEIETAYFYAEILAKTDRSIEVKYLVWAKQSANQWLQKQAAKLLPVATGFPYKLPEITHLQRTFNHNAGFAADTWKQLPKPEARSTHTAVWTGSEMIIWGGVISTERLNTGGIYDPVTDMWMSTSTIGAPSARNHHTAVWTGSEMLVWGGYDGSYLNSGGIYDPLTDKWSSTTTVGGPPARERHTAVWSGAKMIVWGGNYGTSDLDSGISYDLENDIW